MRRLLILRHAKSDWSTDAPTDHDRPLNKRGKKVAPVMAKFLMKKGLAPDAILCSTARRAVETLAPLLERLPRMVTTAYERELYLADPETLLERLRELPSSACTVLLIGHNPGLEQLAAMLVSSEQSEDFEEMSAKYPTGALAVIEFAADDWRDVAKGTGRLAMFTKPRALIPAEEV